jgi:ribonucleoside-diphosphate reductase alpha chain
MQPKDIIVFSFPIKSPEGAVTRNDLTATQHLDLWRVYQSSWCEHKPSITISVKEAEWMQVGSYVWDNFDEMCGVSFLPFTDHVYRQAPYQDLEQSEYDTAMAKMPESIDWSKLSEFESEDRTTSSQEFACTAEACEIVDIGDNVAT